MKIMFYALRPFDEQAYCEPYSKQYGIDYAYTAEVPTPDNLELAKGCDAVSTNIYTILKVIHLIGFYSDRTQELHIEFIVCHFIQ